MWVVKRNKIHSSPQIDRYSIYLCFTFKCEIYCCVQKWNGCNLTTHIGLDQTWEQIHKYTVQYTSTFQCQKFNDWIVLKKNHCAVFIIKSTDYNVDLVWEKNINVVTVAVHACWYRQI